MLFGVGCHQRLAHYQFAYYQRHREYQRSLVDVSAGENGLGGGVLQVLQLNQVELGQIFGGESFEMRQFEVEVVVTHEYC